MNQSERGGSTTPAEDDRVLNEDDLAPERRCTVCGKTIPEDAKFCPQCGSSQLGENNEDRTTASAPGLAGVEGPFFDSLEVTSSETYLPDGCGTLASGSEAVPIDAPGEEIASYPRQSEDAHPAPEQAEDESWGESKTRKQHPTTGSVWLLVALIFLVVSVFIFTSGPLSNSGPSGHSRLSSSTRQEIYFNIVATQDLNPYSNEWNEGVKRAAADSYGVPMSEINDIIHEGATNNWLTPPPP